MTNLQRGIAIGPILFVVALLAILATAISAGTGVFNGDTSAVKAKAQASAILEYANEVKMAVDRVRGHGCSNMEVSFENPIVSGYTNSNAPSDKSCHVFDVNGGGTVWKKPPDNVSGHNEGYFYTGDYNFTGNLPSGGGEQPNNDLVMFLLDINENVCAEINRMLFQDSSIPTSIYSPASFVEMRKFGIHFYWVGYGYNGGSDHPTSSCGLWPSVIYPAGTKNDQYIFYNVLITN